MRKSLATSERRALHNLDGVQKPRRLRRVTTIVSFVMVMAPVAACSSSNSSGASGPTASLSTTTSAAATSAAASSAAATSAAATSAAASSPAASSAASTGAGAGSDPIKIGIEIPDVSAIYSLSPSFNQGNQQQQWQAAAAKWLQPINGHPIQLSYASYFPLGANTVTSAQSACTQLSETNHVIAVVDPSAGTIATGDSCLTTQHHIAVISGNSAATAVTTQQLAAAKPNYFIASPTIDQEEAAWPRWAKSIGILKTGVKIGIYHLNDSVTQSIVAPFKSSMTQLGYKITVDGSTSQPLGGPADAATVEKMKAAGVTLVFLMGAEGAFLHAAQNLNYHPTYVFSDMTGGASTSGAAFYPPTQTDNAYAMTSSDINTAEANGQMSAAETECVDQYKTFSGTTVNPQDKKQYGIFSSLVGTCAAAQMLEAALQKLGSDAPTTENFVKDMSQVTNLSIPGAGSISFTADNHSGTASLFASYQWKASCICFQPIRGLQAY